MDCRFANQLECNFTRQITKCSSDNPWAVLPAEPTKNEKRFIVEQNIQRIDVPLDELVIALLQAGGKAGQDLAANA